MEALRRRALMFLEEVAEVQRRWDPDGSKHHEAYLRRSGAAKRASALGEIVCNEEGMVLRRGRSSSPRQLARCTVDDSLIIV